MLCKDRSSSNSMITCKWFNQIRFSLILDTISVTDEELLQTTMAIFCNSLEQVSSDPIHNIKMKVQTPGNGAKSLSEFILQKKESVEFSKRASCMVEKIANIMRMHDIKNPKGRESMWREMHLTVLHNCEREQWDTLILGSAFAVNSSEFLIIYKSLAVNVLKTLLRRENVNDVFVKDTKLSEKEQQVIYYVAGYVIFTLQKNIEEWKVQNIT